MRGLGRIGRLLGTRKLVEFSVRFAVSSKNLRFFCEYETLFREFANLWFAVRGVVVSVP